MYISIGTSTSRLSSCLKKNCTHENLANFHYYFCVFYFLQQQQIVKMNYTNAVMESTKQYLYGFRMPDLKKLWYGSQTDDFDGIQPPSKPLLVKFEAFLVKIQELSLWTDPKSSVMAIGIVHLLYWYLLMTSNR